LAAGSLRLFQSRRGGGGEIYLIGCDRIPDGSRLDWGEPAGQCAKTEPRLSEELGREQGEKADKRFEINFPGEPWGREEGTSTLKGEERSLSQNNGE